MGFTGGSVVKNLPGNAGNLGSTTGFGLSPGKGNGHSMPVFLPRKFQVWRSLVGYSPWGHKRVRHALTTKQQQKSKDRCSEVCTIKIQLKKKKDSLEDLNCELGTRKTEHKCNGLDFSTIKERYSCFYRKTHWVTSRVT